MIEIFKIGEINSTKKTDSEMRVQHFDCDPNFCFNHCSRD